MITVHIMSDSRYPIDRKRLRSLVKKVVANEGVTSDLVVSLAVVGDRKMKQLNRNYHETDSTTDVLSFPYLDPKSSNDKGKFMMHEEEGAVLGDLVISYPQAVKQAREKGVLVNQELDILVEHGLMHLMGKHHD